MSVVHILKLCAKAAERDALEAFLIGLMSNARHAEGLEGVEICRCADDPDTLIAIERWKAHDAHEAYVARRASNISADELGNYLAAAPELLRFEVVEKITA